MGNLKALLLNSGVGRRMGELTRDRPKCLVEVKNGETILYRQIRALLKCGIRDVIVTTGPHAYLIMNYLNNHWSGAKIQYVHNSMYASTNYIYSVLLAKNYVDEDLILMHGDLVFDDEVLEKLIASKHSNAVILNRGAKLPEKDFKGRLQDGLVKEVSVHIFGQGCFPLMPMYKLSLSTFGKWIEEMEVFREQGRLDVYAEDALNNIIGDLDLYPVFIENTELCMEIDDVYDLNQARDRLAHEDE